MISEAATMRLIAGYLGVDAVWWVDAGEPVWRGITRHELWGEAGGRRGKLCTFDLPARDSARATVMLCGKFGAGQVSELEILKTNRRSW